MAKIKNRRSEVYKLIINGDLFEKDPDLMWWKEYDDKGFHYYQIMRGKSLLCTWPEDVTVYVTGNIPVDIMRVGPYYTAVSHKVRSVINTQWNSEAEFLPIRVLGYDKKKEFGNYWVLNVINVIDALDEDYTMWSKGQPPDSNEPLFHVGIIKPALKHEVVQNKGIFKITVKGEIYGSTIFITQHVKKELENAEATLGMDFLPVKVI